MFDGRVGNCLARLSIAEPAFSASAYCGLGKLKQRFSARKVGLMRMRSVLAFLLFAGLGVAYFVAAAVIALA